MKALNQASTCDPLLKLRLVCLEALVWNDAIPSFIRALAFRIMVAGFRQVRYATEDAVEPDPEAEPSTVGKIEIEAVTAIIFRSKMRG